MNKIRTHEHYVHALAIASWLLSYILTGRIVWHWISPESFLSALVFFILWVVFGYLVQTILFLTITLIARSTTPDQNDEDHSPV